MYKKVFTLLLLLLPFQLLIAQKSLLKNFPEGYTPDEIGRRISYRFVTEKHALHAGKWIGYPETFYWNGSLKYAAAAKDKALIKLLQARFEHLFTTEKALLPIKNHVDLNMFGSLPLELYWVTKDERYKEVGLPYADTQWEVPEDAKPEEKAWAEKGYSWQTRLWIDDMYMITIVQTHAYKVTNDSKYIDRAAKEMVMYLDELQRPNGLFYHAPDVPFYWGRGNGWMAVGMPLMLKAIDGNPAYKEEAALLRQEYETMMASLLKYQQMTGMWAQLVDKTGMWSETSGSAMFAYAFIEGVRNGWLDHDKYGAAAAKAWKSLVSYLNPNYDIREVCEGTGTGTSEQYYRDRKRYAGDTHGQAAMLWCAYGLTEIANIQQ